MKHFCYVTLEQNGTHTENLHVSYVSEMVVQRINCMWLSFHPGIFKILLLVYLDGLNHILYSFWYKRFFIENWCHFVLFMLNVVLISLILYWRVIFSFVPSLVSLSVSAGRSSVCGLCCVHRERRWLPECHPFHTSCSITLSLTGKGLSFK